MGYSLTTLAKLPYDKDNEFYIFILGANANWKGGILESILKNFDYLAEQIGPNAIIAKGLKPREWTYEISQKYFSDINNIGELFPGLLITNSHPDTFDESSLRILVSLKQIEDNFENIEQFFNLLSDFISKKDDKFIQVAEKKISWIEKANQALELKPNFIGIGLNINKLIELNYKKDKSPIIKNVD